MQKRYNFIKLEKVILRNFSLYKKNGKVCDIDETINAGVYCLAGANGLGKTTFLNAINYGLTGIVLEPEKTVYSPGEIVKFNHGYTERYFKGRIVKKDEKNAEIEILLRVNDKYFRIIRSFFERDKLRLLEIFSIEGNTKIDHFESKNKNPKELNDHYQQLLAIETGFINFDYFVFYQLYVLTFDENRRMIFWDDRASSQALAIAFNSEPDDAEKILDLARKMEKHESNGRNARWSSTQAKKKIEELMPKNKDRKSSDLEELEREFKILNRDLEKAQKVYENISIEYDTMLKRQSSLNSEIMQLKTAHTKLFSRYSRPRAQLLENTNIQLSIKKQECWLCGAVGSYIADNIEKSVRKGACPLCNTAIDKNYNADQDKLLKLIKKNDENITSKNSELDDLTQEIEGKKTDLDKAEIELKKVKNRVKDFSEDNPEISFKGTGNKKIDALIEQYRSQYERADKEAKEEYAKRDNLKPEYERLLKKVESSYREAETVFVPTFKKLAKSFIGLDLQIQPQRNNRLIKLVLELQNTARTESFQLSESQRFFLDIALRMALAILLSGNNDGATMIIDTPEGSLDITYENRVGDMFAQYVTTYHQNLFMTANINTSQLLLSLARKCGRNNMEFRRMIEWTDPSEIQKEGEYLFKQVFDSIEAALNEK